MFQMETTREVFVGKDLVILGLIVFTVIVLYFFSVQIQTFIAKLSRKFTEKLGIYSVTREYSLQRYVYQHRNSLVAKLYMWVNEQLIALGLKREGITPFGYLMFWALISCIIGIVTVFTLSLSLWMMPLLCIILFVCLLIMTRVMVSERMEKREADVMNAVDLIVPEVRNGVKNAIITYKDNFAPSLREDFAAFIANIQDRGYTFPDAMYILADNLGLVFYDFAQKAIYYEAIGESEMLDIFSDITETNRLRRQLRDENKGIFANLKTSFTVSSLMTVGYFCFLMFTDSFSRNFFLVEPYGQLLLIVIILVIFLVLAYISTIRSRAI